MGIRRFVAGYVRSLNLSYDDKADGIQVATIRVCRGAPSMHGSFRGPSDHLLLGEEEGEASVVAPAPVGSAGAHSHPSSGDRTPLHDIRDGAVTGPGWACPADGVSYSPMNSNALQGSKGR